MHRRWLPLLAIALLACSGGSEPGSAEKPSGTQPPASTEALVEHGRKVFMANCIACHNPDPRQPGAVGPAIAGSSEALVSAKVLRNEYPPGYTPQRTTHAMIPLPHLEPEIPALAAYLAQAAHGG
jgi:mono/diheme cytochrome c family protein